MPCWTLSETWGAIFFPVFALQDHTAALRLETAANNFERGRMDTFNLVAADVGKLTHVVVVKEGGGLGGDWHLQMVEVLHTGVFPDPSPQNNM